MARHTLRDAKGRFTRKPPPRPRMRVAVERVQLVTVVPDEPRPLGVQLIERPKPEAIIWL